MTLEKNLNRLSGSIPVFLHYCGGEVENVNFVIKGSTACCGEEEDSEPLVEEFDTSYEPTDK